EVVSEYTKGELREVMSLPLKLTPVQKEMFIYKVLEDYYLYRGRYYFLGNNCATESLRLLRAVLTDDEFAGLEQLSDPVSPIAVKKALIESGLADDSVLKDTQAAVESGHYYRSFAVDLENAHKFISSKYPAFKERF